MLLTLKQPVQHCFHKSFHDYSPPTPPATSLFSPKVASSGSHLPPSLPASSGPSQSMSTPHRGLPPPAAMNLPPPTQQTSQMGQQIPMSQGMGQLPAPPLQWQGAEESMRNWLHAKAEEEKRKQEEEKTRQESLRLEQRKIEQDMLRISLAGGIPPYMVPMVFAGMGGGNLPNASLEWAQHYFQVYQAQQQQQQQQQQQLVQQAGQPSPEARREPRAPPQPYNAPGPSVPGPVLSTPGASSSASGPPSAGFVPGYQMSPRSRQPSGPLTMTRVAQGSQLPRLSTEEPGIQQAQQQQALPGMQVLPGQPSHPLQQSQTVQSTAQEPQPSPSIYFHHWQPPATTQAPSASTTQPISPDTITSPRKRKATGPPTRYNSPPFSQGASSSISSTPSRRRGHSRQRSDVSAGRGQESFGRPGSRHRHSESGGSTTAPGGIPQQSMYASQIPLSSGSAQEGLSSMQSVLSFSQQQLPRFPQERYETRQQQRRYSAGPQDTRIAEQQQHRTPPSGRDEPQRSLPPSTESGQPPR